ncbi:UNVERIFIED_CONTAM: hypothetical protein FKN15_068603 [Acipenser sinensis]
MPKSCVVVGCHNHDYMKDKRLSFFELPKRPLSPDRRDEWLSAIHRQHKDGSIWSPPDSRTICSEHFIHGIRTQLLSAALRWTEIRASVEIACSLIPQYLAAVLVTAFASPCEGC